MSTDSTSPFPNDPNKNTPKFVAPDKRNLLFESLEERVLFDAVPGAPDADMFCQEVVVGPSADTSINASAAESTTDQSQQSTEVVFVDKNVENYQELLAEFVEGRDVDVFFINDTSPGLEQIANHLEGRSQIDAIHILSHGDDAQLRLGNSVIGTDDLSAQQDTLGRIGAALSESGDILIYGCDLASTADGQDFVQQFASLTMADVAASDDLTGNAEAGGDWELETQIGSIEATVLSATGYEGVLLVTDDGFVVGTETFANLSETAVVPEGQPGVSSVDYPNAATANNGAIGIDLRLTLIDTFDENGVVTTGTAEQLPVTFTDFVDGPILLSRDPGASVSGFEGHTAHVAIEFFDSVTGNPLSVVGDFTFRDIDFIPVGGADPGVGAEAVTVISDQLDSYQLSTNPATSIETVVNSDGTTTFTNTTTSGAGGDEERWVRATFEPMPELNLFFQSRAGNTGYGLSTTNFTATPIVETAPVATDDVFTTDQDTTLAGNLILNDNGNGADSDPEGDPLTTSLVNGDAANVGVPVAGSTGGLFTVNADGSYTFDPNEEFDHLLPGETAISTITYQVIDPTGLSDTATVTVTITGTDDSPIPVGTIPNQSDVDGQGVTPVDTSTFFDPIDTNDTLTYSAGSLPPGLTIDSATGIISGTLDNSASVGGPYTVVVTASDVAGNNTTQTFTWAVSNPGPTAFDNTNTVAEDSGTAAAGNLIADNDGSGVDSDPDGDTLTVQDINGGAGTVGGITSGVYGDIVINADGTYSYSLDDSNTTVNALNVNQTLTDSFAYTVTDSEGGTSTATLVITVNGNNDAPVVGGTLPPQSNLDADVIAGIDAASVFSDPEGSSLTYSATGLPAGLAIDPTTGQISGTIDNSASTAGPYTVVVTATDPESQTATTSFQWTVNNPGPVAVNDGNNTTQSNAVTGNVLSNDSDPDLDTIMVNQVNGQAGNVATTVPGTNGGQFTINADGSYDFEPNSDFDSLAVSETASTSVTYQITDAEGGTDTATLTITVTGTNDSPTAVNSIPDQDDLDADNITLDTAIYFADVDTNDVLTYSASGLPAGLSIDPATGQISGTVDNSASVSGPYSIVVTADDGNGGSVDQTFTWTVTNPGPVEADDFNSTTENVVVGGNVLDNDTDPDNDALFVSAIGDNTGASPANVGVPFGGSSGGQFVVNPDGSYTFDPLSDYDDLAVGETRDSFITYQVNDGEGGTSIARLVVTVVGTNDAPTAINSIPDQSNLDADTIAPVDVTTYFADVDATDVLTYSASGLPTGLSIDPATGLISGTIDNSASLLGPYSVTVTADDGNGGTVDQVFNWSVTNPGPVAVNDSNSTTEDTTVSGNVIPNDSDPDLDDLVVSDLVGANPGSIGTPFAGTNGGLFTVNSDGSYDFDPNGEFEDLAVNETATTSISYEISDGEGGTATAVLEITIAGVNDIPLAINSIPDQSNLDADTVTSLDVTPYFADTDASDSLTYTASGLPDGLSIDAAGNITGTIDNSASLNGPFTVQVTATDDHGATVVQTFQWAVTNPAPTATDNTNAVTENSGIAGIGNVITDNDGSGVDTDPDADDLAVGAVNGNTAGVGNSVSGSFGDLILNADGSYAYTLDDLNPSVNALDTGQTLTDTFTYTVDDAEGGTSQANLTVTINGTNDQPLVVAPINPQTNFDSESIAPVDASTVFADPEGDTLTFSATGLPSGLMIDSSTGLITGTLDSSASQAIAGGIYTVTVTATDDEGLPVSTTFNWTIANPGPVAVDDSNATIQEQVVAGNVLDNDSDPDGDVISVQSVNGQTSNVSTVVAGTNGGQFTINSDGSYDFVPNGDFIYLAQGETATTSVDYLLTDVDGETAFATLEITITGTNDEPVSIEDIPPQANLDADTVNLDVSPFFDDPDLSNTLTFTASGLPQGLSIDASGNISGTIDNSASVTGPYTVTVVADDGFGATVEQTFTWTVDNPGPIAVDDSNTALETSIATGNVFDNDSDPDLDTITVTLVDGDPLGVGDFTFGSNGGEFTIFADGSYEFDPFFDFEFLSAGETLDTSTTYTIEDGEGGVATATLTVTVIGTNEAPELLATLPDQLDVDGDTITPFDAQPFFTDPDGDLLTFSATGLPPGLSIASSGLITGTLDPSASVGGPYTVEITADDGNGGTVSDTIIWQVTNPGPTALANSNMVNESNSLATGNVILDDDGSGVDLDPDGDQLTVTAVDGATGNVGSSITGTYGDLVINSDGTYSYSLDTTNPVVTALSPVESVSESFDYTISDGQGGTSTSTLTITTTGQNDAPVVGGTIPPQADQDGEFPAIVDTSIYFSDPEGDTLSYSATGLPPGLSISSTTGEISGVLTSDASQGGTGGVYNVTVTATDPFSGSVSTTFEWTVTNPAPTATDNTTQVTEGANVPGTGNVINDNDGFGTDNDPDGDTLTVSSVDGSTSGVGSTTTGTYGDLVLNANGTYSYTLDETNPTVDALSAGETLSETFTYTVDDGQGGTATANLTVTINGTNDAPIVVGPIGPQSNLDSEVITPVDTSTAFSDPDGEPLTFAASNLPAGLTLDPVTGIISGTLDSSASQNSPGGIYSVTITATDSSGVPISTTFDWTVANPGPDAVSDFNTTDQSTAVAGNVLDNDSDPDGDAIVVNQINGNAATIGTPVAGSNGGTFTVNGDGSYDFQPGNDFVSLAAGETATTSVTYQITDNEGGTDVATLEIEITGTNDQPVSTGIPDQSNLDADSVGVDIAAYFSDPDLSDTLTFTATGLPPGLVMDIGGNITGTIDNSASLNGPYSVSVLVDDGMGGTITETFQWTVTNPGPVAVDDTNSIIAPNVVTGDVLVNDSDVDGDVITVTAIAGNPAGIGTSVAGDNGGEFVVQSDGSYSFSPGSDFEGLASGETQETSVTYTITDGEGGTAQATLTVTVNGVNDPPVAQGTIPNQASIDDQNIADLDVSSFFSDPEGDVLTFTANGLPPGLTIDAAGNITGTVDNSASVTGPYAVTITADDGNGGTVDQIFNWSVTNPAPTATANTGMVFENSQSVDSGNVISEDDGSGLDNDPDGDQLVVSSINGSGSVGSPIDGTYGSVVINADGSYQYTLDNSLPAISSLAPGATLTDSFDYTVTDNEGGFATSTLTITIVGENDTPVVGGTIPPQANLDGDSPTTIDTSTYFSDPEGETLTYSSSNLPAGLTIDPLTGEISGTIDNSASQISGGVYTIAVTATDPHNAAVTTTFDWTITNPAPTAQDNTNTVSENTGVAAAGNALVDNDGTGIDSDPDNDVLVVSQVNGTTGGVGTTTNGVYGDLVLNADGSYSYSLDDSDPTVNALDTGEILTDTFTYTISDGEGGFSDANLTITINGTNDSPIVVGPVGPQSNLDADTISSVDVSTVFSDPEGDTLVFSATDLPPGLTIDPTTGIISGTVDNSASQTGTGGVYTVTVTAVDDEGLPVSTTFDWTIANPGPVAVDDVNTTLQETPVAGNVLDNDSDPDADVITVNQVDGTAALVAAPVAGTDGGQFTINADGSYSFDPAGDFIFLAEGETATTSVTYQITDAEGGQDFATLEIEITGINDEPVGSSIPDQNNLDADVINLDLSPFFSDPDLSNTLTYVATGLPTGLTMDGSGNISGTIDNSASQSGPYTVTVVVDDGFGGTVSETFNWNVVNPGPVAVDDAEGTSAGNQVNGNVLSNDSDPDLDTITVVSVDGDPTAIGLFVFGTNGGEFTIYEDGSYQFDTFSDFDFLTAGETLDTSVIYSISDGEGGTATATLTVTVTGENEPPEILSTIPNQLDTDGDTISPFTVSPFFIDPDGNQLSFTATGLPPGLSIDPSGDITGTVDGSASVAGPYTVTVTADDGFGGTISQDFVWNVNNTIPTALDNEVTVSSNQLTANGDVLSDDDGFGTDNDADGDTLVVNAIAGDTGAVGIPVTTTYGSVAINADGTYTYSLDDTNSAVQNLQPGESLTDTVDYTITDNEGGTSTATLTVVINGANEFPVVIGGTIPPQFDVDGTTVTDISASDYFSDPDGDALTYSASNLPAGITIDPITGLISGTLDTSASQGGVHSVIVTATDPFGQSVSTTFEWTVTNPIPVATDDNFTTDEDTPVSGSVATNDSDPDNDALTFTQLTNANNGVVTVNPDGSFTYSPTANFSGTDSFDYLITDADGATTTATVNIDVTPVDDPTTVNPIPDQADQDADIISLDIANNFSDPDNSLTFSATGLPPGLTLSPAGLISGTLDTSASANGPYTIVVTASGGTNPVTDTFTWTVTNPAPVAADGSYTTEEDTPVSGVVIATDADNDGLTYSQLTNPVSGAVAFNTDGSFEYTPGAQFNGTVSFDYQVEDADGAISTATVTIAVTGENDPPVVDLPIADQANVDGEAINLSVANSFSDPDGDPLTFTATGLPPGLSIDGQGNITGTLDTSASNPGVYTVVVTADDGFGATATDTFSWTVTNPIPVAADGSYTTAEETTVSGIVTATDPDNDALVFSQLTNANNGTVVFNSDGSFDYTPDAGFNGTDSFDYEVVDAEGAISTATVTIVVTGQNDPPVVDSPIADQVNTDSEFINLSVANSFSDEDGNALTFSATGLPPGLSIDGQGNITGTLDSSASDPGTYTVVVTADDGFGGTVTDTFSWTVTNPAPTAADGSYTTGEETPVSGMVTGSDPDNDVLTYTQLSEPTSGTVVFNPDGSFVYTPDADFNGSDSFDYTVTDADGAVSTATVTIVVTGQNDPPVVDSPIADQVNTDSEVISLSVADSFSDQDGDPLTFSATGLPPGLSINSQGDITGTLDSSASTGGPYTVMVTADDGLGGTVTDTFSWTVTNPGPVALDDGYTGNEDTPVAGMVGNNDSDPDGDSLSYLQLSEPNNGTVVFNPDGSFTYTPDPGFNGTDTFDYAVTDADGQTATATVTIDIAPVNDSPVVVTPIPDQSDFDSDIVFLNVAGNFDDPDGNPLTFNATGLPPGLSIDPSGNITGTLDSSASAGGPYTVTILADDGNNGTTSTTFEWTVTNPDPNAVNDGYSTAQDVTVSGATGANDSDPDGDTLTYNQLTNPNNGTVVWSSDGTFTYTPDSGFTGIDSFDYEVVDADGQTATATVTISVGNVNDPPQITTPLVDQVHDDSTAILLDVSSSFSDADGDPLTFTATGLPPGLSIDSAGNITGTLSPNASQGGPYTVVVTADDGLGATGSDSFIWTVNNPTPTATDNVNTVVEDSIAVATGNLLNDNDGFGIDSDPDGDSLTVSMVDGLANNVGATLNGDYGTVQVNPDGTYSYTLDNTNPAVNGLAPGETLVETFGYTIDDGDGGTDMATLSVTIQGTDDVPTTTATIPDLVNTDGDLVTVVDVSNYFEDPEDVALTFTATGLPPGVTLNPITGEILGAIPLSGSNGGPAGDGVYQVTVTATDDSGQTVTADFTWTVNNPAPIAVDDMETTAEDTPVSGTVAGNDSDPDNDPLTYAISSEPTNGTVSLNPDGTFTYTPDANYNGTDQFAYTVTDVDGATSSAVVTLTVTGVNDPVTVSMPLEDQVNTDSSNVNIDITSAFDDVDGDTLIYTATGLPDGLSLDPSTGLITGQLDSSSSANGPYTVTITADDGNGGASSESFEITIENPVPIANADSFTTPEDTAVSGTLVDNDSDPDNDALLYLVATNPANGAVLISPDGTFTYTPDPGFTGTDTFTYDLVDADGAVSSAVVTIAVTPAANDSPVIVNVLPPYTGIDGEGVNIDITPGFNDPDGDPLSYTATDLPPGLSLDPVTGVITGTFPSGASADGPYSVAVTATDPSGQSVTQTLVLNVNNVAPIAVDDQYATTTNNPVLGQAGLNDSDPDGDSLTYTLASPPTVGGLSFNPDGTFVYTPAPGFEGPVTFDYQITDANGATSTATVTINVTNTAVPIAVDDSGATNEQTPVIVNLLSNDLDPVATGLTVTEIEGTPVVPGQSVTLASGAVVTLNDDGTVAFDPNGVYEDLKAGESAIDSFEYTVRDSMGATAVAETVITISGENDSPIAFDDFVQTVVDQPVTLDVLDNDQDVEGQTLAIVLLNQPEGGTAVVNSDGSITFTPDPEFEGLTSLHYLVEDPDGGSAEATVTIDVIPAFAFDSFTNVSELFDTGPSNDLGRPTTKVLSQKIFALAPEPIFSGYARPGTQIVGRIYDSAGNLVGSSTALTDPGGNWLMQFQGTTGQEFYRIEFEQVAASGIDIYGYLGLNPADNSYQAMEALTAYDRPLSVEGAIQDSASNQLNQSHQTNQDSLGFGQADD